MNYYLLIVQILFLILNSIPEVKTQSIPKEKELYECEVTEINDEDLDETFIITYNLYKHEDLKEFQHKYKQKLNITVKMNYSNIEIKSKPLILLFSEDVEEDIDDIISGYVNGTEEDLLYSIGKVMYLDEEEYTAYPIGQYRYDLKFLKRELRYRGGNGTLTLTCYNAIHLHIHDHCFENVNVTNFGVEMNGEFRTFENEGECNWVTSIPKLQDDLEFSTIFYKNPDDPKKFGYVRKNDTSSWIEGEGNQNTVDCTKDDVGEGINDIRMNCSIKSDSSNTNTPPRPESQP